MVTVTVDDSASGATTDEADRESEPEGVSRGRYQEILTRGSKRIARAIHRLGEAKTYEALLRRSEAAARTTLNVGAALEKTIPPEGAERAHELHVRALAGLARSLGFTTDAVASRSICAVPAMRVRLGSLSAAADVKRARRALLRAGYEIPLLVPRPVLDKDRELPNGTFIVDGDRSGYGQLKIENGRVVDGVVAASRGDVVAFAVYVQAKNSFTVTGIPDGEYRVAFTYGTDWDSKLGRFTKKCDFSVFDEALAYQTTYHANGDIGYQGWEISLQPVKGGTGRTSSLQPDDFPALDN